MLLRNVTTGASGPRGNSGLLCQQLCTKCAKKENVSIASAAQLQISSVCKVACLSVVVLDGHAGHHLGAKLYKKKSIAKRRIKYKARNTV